MTAQTRRGLLRHGAGAVSALLAGCTGETQNRTFEDSGGTATVELVGANMRPQRGTFFLRCQLTRVPLCRFEATPCAGPRSTRQLLRATYDLAADEVRPLAAVTVELRSGDVAIVTVAASDKPFAQWPAPMPSSNRIRGADLGARRLSEDLHPAFSLVPDTTQTVRITNRIHGWEFFAE